jgi:hypothetical protein
MSFWTGSMLAARQVAQTPLMRSLDFRRNVFAARRVCVCGVVCCAAGGFGPVRLDCRVRWPYVA